MINDRCLPPKRGRGKNVFIIEHSRRDDPHVSAAERSFIINEGGKRSAESSPHVSIRISKRWINARSRWQTRICSRHRPSHLMIEFGIRAGSHWRSCVCVLLSFLFSTDHFVFLSHSASNVLSPSMYLSSVNEIDAWTVWTRQEGSITPQDENKNNIVVTSIASH